jgi:hypothetical protein
MGYNDCKKCNRKISRYEIDRLVNEFGSEYVRTYKFKFCWGCGYFSIYPNVHDEFTTSIMRNKMMIIELIENKQLRPVS